jgi:hypothetical protein
MSTQDSNIDMLIEKANSDLVASEKASIDDGESLTYAVQAQAHATLALVELLKSMTKEFKSGRRELRVEIDGVIGTRDLT